MSAFDIAAAATFALVWLFYEPLLRSFSGGRGGINRDMVAIRAEWMRRMIARENRIADSNLIGHLLSSTSFFASTNILIIAAAMGVLLGGENMMRGLTGIVIFEPAPIWLLEVKIGVVAVTLSRGLLDFIWSIRQLNYCVALIGAAPEAHDPDGAHYAGALANVLTPALSSFNTGVRAYYFALAGAAWLVSPWAMVLGVLAAFTLLARRQTRSTAAAGIRAAREFVESEKDV
ncbi:MAG: DUF599 family protein [Alphaproteobacteria bacterium]|nr:DUF599 family protein [Alphaproteobacteria bacterium]